MHGCKAGWPCALLQHARRPFHAKGAVGRALANLAARVCGACAVLANEGRARSSTSWPFPMRFETRKRAHCGLFRVCEAACWLCDAGAGFVPSIDVSSISRNSIDPLYGKLFWRHNLSLGGRVCPLGCWCVRVGQYVWSHIPGRIPESVGTLKSIDPRQSSDEKIVY